MLPLRSSRPVSDVTEVVADPTEQNGTLDAPRCVLRGDGAFAKSLFEKLLKARIVFQELVDQVVVLFQRGQLKRWHTLDRHNDWFAVAEATVIAEPRLGFTQRDDFHDAR